MSHLWNLVRKELKELLTPAALLSVIVVTVLFIALGSFMGGETKDMADLKPIGYVDLSEKGYAKDYTQIGIDGLKAYYDQYGGHPSADYVKKFDMTSQYGTDAFYSEMYNKMVSEGVDTVLVILPDFNKNLNSWEYGTIGVYWNQTSLGLFSAISATTSQVALQKISASISEDILKNTMGVPEDHANVALYPCYFSGQATFLKGTLHDGVSPDEVYNAMSQQNMFVPIIIMLIIVMIGSIVISSMGNEKENKTLETLLTLPVNRTTIVAGKLIGSTIAGLVMGALYMVGMYFYVTGMSGGSTSKVTLDSLGLALSITDWVVVIAFMFLAIICALGLCMILGAMAKNYKAAQTYIMPISILAVIPMFVTMFSSIDSLPMAVQVLLFAIPFTHPMVIMQNLMFGNTAWIVGGAVYLVLFTAVTFFVTVKIYNSDILITGLKRKSRGKRPGEDQDEEIIESVPVEKAE